MSTTLKVWIILGIVFAGLLLSVISWNNSAVAAQEGVKAQWRNNQNEYDSFWKKVQEVAQVPSKYKDDFKDILVSETQAKYGAEGSKATFQWFTDRNIVLSDQMYLKVQNVIEAGRNDFKRGQSELIDKQRVFTTTLMKFPGSLCASILGIPSPVGGDFAPPRDADGDGRLTVLDYPIVTSTKTEEVFKSGKDDKPVNVFGN